MTKWRVAAAAIMMGIASPVAADPSPAAKTLFDSCMNNPRSTAKFCRCGVDHYESRLSPREFALVAAISAQVAAGRNATFDVEASRLGFTSAEKGAALTRIGEAAKSAAETCDPLIKN